MRYTQTELDKIMMIGFGKIDNAVEAVIEKYCPSPKPERKPSQKISGVRLEHEGVGIYIEAGCSGIVIENCTITTKPESTAFGMGYNPLCGQHQSGLQAMGRYTGGQYQNSIFGLGFV